MERGSGLRAVARAIALTPGCAALDEARWDYCDCREDGPRCAGYVSQKGYKSGFTQHWTRDASGAFRLAGWEIGPPVPVFDRPCK